MTDLLPLSFFPPLQYLVVTVTIINRIITYLLDFFYFFIEFFGNKVPNNRAIAVLCISDSLIELFSFLYPRNEVYLLRTVSWSELFTGKFNVCLLKTSLLLSAFFSDLVSLSSIFIDLGLCVWPCANYGTILEKY